MFFSAIATVSTFSLFASFVYFYPKYLLLGIIRFSFFRDGFRVKSVTVGSKTSKWGKCRICYAERKARGPRTTTETLLLIHGFTASKDVWLPVCRKIPRNIRIIAIDLPGHGGSSTPSVVEYEAHLEMMMEAIKKLQLENVVVVGFSMGGPLAAMLTLKVPRLAKQLILVAPAMKPPVKSEFWEMIDRGECPFLTKSVDDFTALLQFLRHKRTKISRTILRAVAALRGSYYSYYLSVYKEMFHEDNFRLLETLAPDVKTPTFLVWGENDRVIDCSAGEVLRTCLGSSCHDLVIIPECGHSVTMEQPTYLATLILQWLSQYQRQQRLASISAMET